MAERFTAEDEFDVRFVEELLLMLLVIFFVTFFVAFKAFGFSTSLTVAFASFFTILTESLEAFELTFFTTTLANITVAFFVRLENTFSDEATLTDAFAVLFSLCWSSRIDAFYLAVRARRAAVRALICAILSERLDLLWVSRTALVLFKLTLAVCVIFTALTLTF